TATHADRRFYGFDVFGMIPPPTSDKDDSKSKERYQTIAEGRSEGIGGDTYYGYRSDLYEQVKRSFNKYEVPIDEQRRFLRKGLFEYTLPDYRGVIAFAHIDCDWYEPVKLCLNEVARNLSVGGLIVLDDYYDYGGAKTATDEFLAETPTFRLSHGANAVLT